MARRDLILHTCPDCGGPRYRLSARCRKCQAARARTFRHPRSRQRPEPPPVPTNDDKPFPMGGLESEKYGAITTLENADGRRLVLHRSGTVKPAVREACRAACELDPSFRVISVYTPTSIYTDLQGNRLDTHGSPGGKAMTPEAWLGDMLHPRLR